MIIRREDQQGGGEVVDGPRVLITAGRLLVEAGGQPNRFVWHARELDHAGLADREDGEAQRREIEVAVEQVP